MDKYKFEFDLSISIQDVLDADDGKVNFETSSNEKVQEINTCEKDKD